MRADEITDIESFEAWLETRPKETRREEGIALICRAATRVFSVRQHPILEDTSRPPSWMVLPMVRMLVTASVVAKLPSVTARSAAAASQRFALAENNISTSNKGQVEGMSFSISTTMTITRADIEATVCAASIAEGESDFDRAVVTAAQASIDKFGDPQNEKFWQALSHDCTALIEGEDLLNLSLWGQFSRDPMKATHVELHDWIESPPGYAFWARWYEAILDGRPLTGDWDSHWQLLHDIALIPDADWEKGAEHVAGLIEEIERPFALKMTESNERVVVNPDTQRLTLEPIAPLQEDFSSYVRRKLTKALKVFGPNPGNQYTALLPELSLLAEALEGADNLPVELYDTCTSITKRLAARINTGELPAEKDDALLGDFLNRIRETGAEIFAEDPETQKAIERRKRIEPNAALAENTEALRLVAEEIAKRSDPGPLARLPGALDAVSDPNRSAEEKHAESVKFAGRVLRVFKVCSAIVGGGAATGLAAPVATKEAIEAYRWLATDPAVQQAYRIILQFLGLA